MQQFESEFFKKMVPAAQAAQRRWRVPASITLAQAVLESGWGRSALARLANNYFGIKAVAQAGLGSYVEFSTNEFIDGRRTQEMARFARYPSPSASFDAHAVLLATLSRYRRAMASCDVPELFAQELQACGYSTNPNYAAALMQIVRQYDLTQYDVPPGDPAAQEVAA